MENEDAGLKRAGKLGVERPLVEAHLDSWSIHRGQGSKDRRNKQPSQLLLLQSNEKITQSLWDNLNIVSPRIRNSDQSGGIYNSYSTGCQGFMAT